MTGPLYLTKPVNEIGNEVKANRNTKCQEAKDDKRNG